MTVPLAEGDVDQILDKAMRPRCFRVSVLRSENPGGG